jgi:predicted phage tail protein
MGLAERRPESKQERIHLVEHEQRRERKGLRNTVTGWVLIAFAVLAAVFVPQDVRLGGIGVVIAAAVLGVIGLGLIAWGAIQRGSGMTRDRE